MTRADEPILPYDIKEIEQAVSCLQQGKIIAYPTESVYGLGCDPFNYDAVMQLLRIKEREIEKGFILIAADWEQVSTLVEPIEPHALARVLSTWPGPVTWVFPAQMYLPHWIRGSTDDVALRVTAHPVAQAICRKYGKPIISTSANASGHPPTRDYRATLLSFGDRVGMVVNGKVGERLRPSEIRDAITGEVLRPG